MPSAVPAGFLEGSPPFLFLNENGNITDVIGTVPSPAPSPGTSTTMTGTSTTMTGTSTTMTGTSTTMTGTST
ncbi:hypothetical protein QUB70_17295, partial [Microcoleus sp. A003_D6]|uniref:hypothetical protein n=1 Tax=Microcoleus sp. A003_D6 TaxID=3055266 RepID=UPI002FD0F88E